MFYSRLNRKFRENLDSIFISKHGMNNVILASTTSTGAHRPIARFEGRPRSMLNTVRHPSPAHDVSPTITSRYAIGDDSHQLAKRLLSLLF